MTMALISHRSGHVTYHKKVLTEKYGEKYFFFKAWRENYSSKEWRRI